MKDQLERAAAALADRWREHPSRLLAEVPTEALTARPIRTTDDGREVRYWRCEWYGCIYGFSGDNLTPWCHGAPMTPAPDHDPDAVKIARTADAVATDTAGPGAGPCTRMGRAWWCTGDQGHDGPCAAWPKDPRDLPDVTMIGDWIAAATAQNAREAHRRESSEPLRGTPPPDQSGVTPPSGDLAAAIRALPASGGLMYAWRYDTDDQHVLTLAFDGQTFDLRVAKDGSA